jgi:hypothetical protein
MFYYDTKKKQTIVLITILCKNNNNNKYKNNVLIINFDFFVSVLHLHIICLSHIYLQSELFNEIHLLKIQISNRWII